MRDFLVDAFKHQDDGFGRAQKHVQRELPKRFYKTAGVSEVDEGFAVTLDDRRTRTPGKVAITVPGRALAEHMAAEWAAQGEHIDPLKMPVVRLVNAGVEAGQEGIEALCDEVVKYAGTDLLCYRADSPRELVAEQEARWDPVLTLLARHYGVSFQTTVGIMHEAQPEATLARLKQVLAPAKLLEATAMASLAGLTGSGLLALGLGHDLLDAEAVWTAAHVDEDYNIKLWGRDPEAEERRTQRRTEFDAAVVVLSHLKTN